MAGNAFFGRPKQQSMVKARIVTGYFVAWARVMANNAIRYPRRWPQRFSYVDLFAGRGRYEDGTASTPTMVLQRAIAEPAIADRVVILLNDVDPDACTELRRAVAETPGVDRLATAPLVTNMRVDTDLARQLERPLVPTLFFLDPWGYKGLSLDLISAAVKDRGSECILFFNFNRINMHLGNPTTQQSLADLLGPDRLRGLLPRIQRVSGGDREELVMGAAEDALRDSGAEYIRGFRFMDDAGGKTSHYIIHAAKDYAAYDIMRNIMAGESSSSVDGISSYSFDRAKAPQLSLFEEHGGHERLAEELLVAFAGQTLTRDEICRQHSVGTDYREQDYRIALLLLEGQGRIACSPSDRPPGTLASHIKVTFPDQEGGNDGTV